MPPHTATAVKRLLERHTWCWVSYSPNILAGDNNTEQEQKVSNAEQGSSIILEYGRTKRTLWGTTHNHAETFSNTCVTSPRCPDKHRAEWVALLTSPPSGKRIWSATYVLESSYCPRGRRAALYVLAVERGHQHAPPRRGAGKGRGSTALDVCVSTASDASTSRTASVYCGRRTPDSELYAAFSETKRQYFALSKGY